jgi:hypothetical protein
MEEITTAILQQVERADPDFVARDVGIDVLPRGLFEKKKHLRLFGVVRSEKERDIVLSVARDRAGDAYDVVDELRVH